MDLSLPSITRKTDKGLPRYQNDDDSDVFILSGAEDLVPVLTDTGIRKSFQMQSEGAATQLNLIAQELKDCLGA